jgi:hypothetical protein
MKIFPIDKQQHTLDQNERYFWFGQGYLSENLLNILLKEQNVHIPKTLILHQVL